MKLEPKTIFQQDDKPIAVIWADGERCDGAGVMASINGDWVQFDGVPYPPGQGFTVENRTLVIPEKVAQLMWRLAKPGEPAPGSRAIYFIRCTFRVMP